MYAVQFDTPLGTTPLGVGESWI